MNWRGRPLTSHEVVVDLIAAITTREGLAVRAEIDARAYPKGRQDHRPADAPGDTAPPE